MHRLTNAARLTSADIRKRRLLLALCALAILSVVACGVYAYEYYGLPGGYNYGSTRTPLVDRVTDVVPGGTAAQAGLRVGDLIDTRSFSPAERYRWHTSTIAGQPLRLPILRHARALTITYTPKRWYIRWDAWFLLLGSLWMLSFAALLAWRRPESAEARVLCVLLVAIVLGIDLEAGSNAFPLLPLQIACNVAGALWNNAGWPLLAVYSLLFAKPTSALRRILAGLSYVTAAVSATYGVLILASYYTGFTDPLGPALNGAVPQIVYNVLEPLFPLLCALVTIAAARGAERERITWTTLTLGLLFADTAISGVIWLFPNVSTGLLLYEITNILMVIAPLGMTYALLNRRLLDIGFAINRAVVFTCVSIVIVGIFVLVEWALSEWFSSASHTTNLAISAVLALVLGLSVRAIHTRVDRVLDSVFFRKRHEDEQAIRSLAREAAYITDPQVLLSRMTAVLEEHAYSTGVHVLLEHGGGYEPCHPERREQSEGNRGTGIGRSVSENDPAIVRLRATHKVLDVHTVETAIHGEFAYPMVARGRLVGALVLGPKRSGESYAPDESDAIAQLAHDAGAALDVLALKDEQEKEQGIDLRREIHDIHETMRALRSRLELGALREGEHAPRSVTRDVAQEAQ